MNDDFDDIKPERDWFHCPKCDEEYYLSEETEECPVCGCNEIGLA